MQKITEKEISLTISPDDYVFVTQPVVREDGSTIDALRRVKLSSILSLFSGGGSAPGESGGTTDHSQLSNRDAADQHPIGAIAGLKEELEQLEIKIEDNQSSQNANKTLTFIGAVSATYDGTEEVTVKIPTGGSGGGLTTNAITLLTDILRHAFYVGDYDSEGNITKLAEELAKTGSGSGGGSGGDSTIYTITYNLANTVCSVSTSTISAGSPFSATLTAEENYNLDAVTVTMGGEDVTENVYSDGEISISAVTGNVVIVAVSQPNTVIMVNGRFGVNYNVDISNHNTVELSGIKANDVINTQHIYLLDKTQEYATATTKFHVEPGDVVEISVALDEKTNINTGVTTFQLMAGTTAISFSTLWSYLPEAIGKTHTASITMEAAYDITELDFYVRYLRNPDIPAEEMYLKMTISLKVNGVEVLG